MEAQVTLSSTDVVTDYAELSAWLQEIPALKPHLTLVEKPAGPNDLSGGGVVALLSVALGTGGVGVALSKALGDWLKSRQIPVTLKVSRGEYTAELSAPRMTAQQIDEALDILRDIARDPGATNRAADAPGDAQS